jgi:hypothetical protein
MALGPDLLIALVVLCLTLGVPIWAVVDAGSRPAAAFFATCSNKTVWIVVVVVAFVLGIGFLLGGYYLLFTRPKVRRQMVSIGY